MRHVSTSLLVITASRPPKSLPSRLHEAVAIDKVAAKFDEEIDTYIAIHAKAECMTLSKMVQSKLPRELRDMVYAHLLPRETYILWNPAHNREWLQSLRTTSCDHLFTRGYVTLDTMKEIGEMWYEVSTFIVLGFRSGDGRNPELASHGLDFLLLDSWGLDIDVRQHVKHIYIRLDYMQGLDNKITQLKSDLRALTSLVANARVILQLQCKHFPCATLAGQQLIGLVTQLQMVFPVLEELVNGGKRVMVNVKGYNVFDVKIEKLNAQSWISQLTKIFSDRGLVVLQP